MDIQPPQGSRIETRRDSDGVTILIPPPRLSDGGFATVLLLLVWLGAWPLGAKAVFDAWSSGAGALILVVWAAGGWSVSGLWAARLLYRLVRMPEQERLTLRASGLAYDSGLPRADVRIWGFRFLGLKPWDGRLRDIFQTRVHVEFDKATLPSLRVSLDDEGRRLIVERGGEPVEIAKYASAAEREYIRRVVHVFYQFPDKGCEPR